MPRKLEAAPQMAAHPFSQVSCLANINDLPGQRIRYAVDNVSNSVRYLGRLQVAGEDGFVSIMCNKVFVQRSSYTVFVYRQQVLSFDAQARLTNLGAASGTSIPFSLLSFSHIYQTTNLGMKILTLVLPF